jgi:uncharacterized membrane protein
MRKNSTLLNGLAFVFALLPLVYLAIVFNSLPDKVAVHYNSNFKPDEIKDKSELWIIAGALAVVSVLIYLLLQNIHRFDPKRRNMPSVIFNKLGFGIVIFLAAITMLIITSAGADGFSFSRLLFPLMGLLFVFLGNYMPALKPNYFAGIRLPWTLSDDDNWRRTHFLAGRIWFWTGLLFAVITLFISPRVSVFLMVPIIVVMILVPAIYSYRLYKEKNKMAKKETQLKP